MIFHKGKAKEAGAQSSHTTNLSVMFLPDSAENQQNHDGFGQISIKGVRFTTADDNLFIALITFKFG